MAFMGGKSHRRSLAAGSIVLLTALLGLWLNEPAAAQERRPGRIASSSSIRQSPVLFNANEVQYDQDLSLIVARGNVEISQNDQVLLADTVTYNQRSDTVTASGHVSLLTPSGEIVFAEYMELTHELRDGFVKDVRMLLSDRSRLAANAGRRIEGNRTELRRAVYSPCDLCARNPNSPPLWQIEADRITHDKELQLVEYRDAFMEIDGIPVFYLPYFSHPDPSVRRRSGFLAPSFGYSNTLGARVEIPYYWAISPDKDMTFSPLFTSKGGEIFAGEYRQRFVNGSLQTSGSAGYAPLQLGTATNPTPPKDDFRYHIFSKGSFDLNDVWRGGFDVRRTSDQTYLRRYGFGGSEPFLTSHGFAEGFLDRTYANIDAYSFQSLRSGFGDSNQAIVSPAAGINWVSTPDALGGRWNTNANLLNLVRPNAANLQRLSLGTLWERPFNGLIGDRFTFTASMRGDGYFSRNVQPTPSNRPIDALTGRAYPQMSLTWRYPWVRRGDGYSQMFEPIVAAIGAPVGGNSALIPNSDSSGFEFDETKLFSTNRFPGYDRVDGGQRVDYGFRAAVYGDGGGSTRLIVGQSYRFQKIAGFPIGSGVENQKSDIVGRVVVSPDSFFDMVYRFRLDKEDFASRRQEFGIITGPDTFRVNLNYVALSANGASTDLVSSHQVTGALTAQVSQYWSVALSGTRNIGSGSATLGSGIALIYRDECLSFVTSLTQSGTRDRDVTPGTTLLFSIVFKNLGDVGIKGFSTGSQSTNQTVTR